MIEKAVVHSASRSIHFGKRWVFSFVLNDAKDCECRTEWELVPGVSSLISKRALTIRLCSDVRNTEKSIIR